MSPAEVQLELVVEYDGFIAASEFADIVTEIERVLWGAAVEVGMRKFGRPLPYFTVGLTSARPGCLRLAGVVSSAVISYHDKLYYDGKPHQPEVRAEVERFIREDLPGMADRLSGLVMRNSISFARTSITRIRRIQILLNRAEDSPPTAASTAAPFSAEDIPLDLVVEFDGFIAGRELVDVIGAVEHGLAAEFRDADPGGDWFLRQNRLPLFHLHATKGPPFTLQGFIGPEAAGYGLRLYNRTIEREYEYAKKVVAKLVGKIRADPGRFFGNINTHLAWTAANDRPSNLRLARLHRIDPSPKPPSPTFIFGPRFPRTEPRTPN